jgi:hypothetical protein
MNTVTDTPLSLSDSAYFAYSDLIMQATMQQVEQASVWYFEAQEVAHNVARNLDVSMEVGASIVAAFSPRERWSSNVHKALSFSMGMQVKGLTNNIKMANDALEQGFDALKGQKTNAFARAIAGDTDAVVIDVWMIRAAGMDASKGVNKGDYIILSDIVRKIANEHGITPRTAQALIWIVKRGNHA